MTSCRWKLLLGAAALIGAVGLAPLPVWAQVPVELFEIHDGNGSNDSANGVDPDPNDGVDWKDHPLVNDDFDFTIDGQTNPYPFYDDPSMQMETTGGTKELDDFPDWQWKFVDKDLGKFDVVHVGAFVTKFDTDTIAYVGFDRLAGGGTQGTTQYVVWFLREACDLTEPAGGGQKGTLDNCEHQDGDIRLASELSGNSVDGIEVCVWSGGALQCADDVAVSVTPQCDDATTMDTGADAYYDTLACGATNTSDVMLPWPAGTTDGQITVGEGRFAEIAVNLTQTALAFGVNEGCATSLLWGASASVGETSAFKNFGLVEFDQCSIEVTKICKTTQVTSFNPLETEIFVQALVENDGGGSLAMNSELTVCDDAGDGFDNPMCPTGGGDALLADAVAISTLPGVCVDGGGSPDPDGTTGLFIPCTSQAICTNAGKTDCSYDQMTLDGGEIVLVEGSFVVSGNGLADNVVAAELVDNVLGIPLGDTNDDLGEPTVTCPPLSLSPMLDIDKVCDVTLVNDNDTQMVLQVEATGRYCNTGEAPLIVDVVNDRNDDGIGSPNDADDEDLESGETLGAGIPCDNASLMCPAVAGSGVTVECVGAGKRCSEGRNQCIDINDCGGGSDQCVDETGVCIVTDTNKTPGVCVSEINGSGWLCAENNDCQQGETCEGAATVCGTYSDTYTPVVGMAGDDPVQPEDINPFSDTVEVRAPVAVNPVLQTGNNGSGFDEFATATNSCEVCPADEICTP